MWIFTEYGFFSAVVDADDKKTMVVRSRDIRHLRTLKSRFVELDEVEIATSYDSDYAFRIRVPKRVWSKLIEQLSEDIHYSNFKSHVLRLQGRNDYERALHEVWQVMAETQPTVPYSQPYQKEAK